MRYGSLFFLYYTPCVKNMTGTRVNTCVGGILIYKKSRPDKLGRRTLVS